MKPQRPNARLGSVWQGVALFGVSVAVGFTVLFATLDMPEGGRAVGLAVSAAVGVASCIKLIGDALSRAIELLKRQPTPPAGPPDGPPDGVDRVYATRVEAQSDIAEALVQQANLGVGTLITCAVAGRDMLQFGGWQYQGESLFSVLSHELHQPGNAVDWDIILLDPDSPEAERRADYERTGQTLAEITLSVEMCRGQFANLSPRIRCWLYSMRPFVFAVVTPEVAFEQRLLSAPLDTPFYGRYGDLTPVFRYRAGSRYYRQLRAELINFRDKDCK
ncbi:MAG: hypothetical protein MUP14_08390 [Dehalococcoidia bacterium]|nr:hypothetical protein [Dehalococcoidia bacterium]